MYNCDDLILSEIEKNTSYEKVYLTNDNIIFVRCDENVYEIIDFSQNIHYIYTMPTSDAAMNRARAQDNGITRIQSFISQINDKTDKLRSIASDISNLASEVIGVIDNLSNSVNGRYNLAWNRLWEIQQLKDAGKGFSTTEVLVLRTEVQSLQAAQKGLDDAKSVLKQLQIGQLKGASNALGKGLSIWSLINNGYNMVKDLSKYAELASNEKLNNCEANKNQANKIKTRIIGEAIGSGTYYLGNIALDLISLGAIPGGITLSGATMGSSLACVGVAVLKLSTSIALSNAHSNHVKQVQAQFRNEIIRLNCVNVPDDNDDNNDNDNHPDDDHDIEDPSGYVYEAVPTNRISGVKATVYYNEDVEDDYPVQWKAEEYGQINPQITDESGLYAWDVPQGMWKVVFEKEGYETTQTDWLPVPPPQLDINIPMSEAVAPYVENAKGVESGITFEFSKYMKPNTLTKSNRVSVTCNGEKVKGDVELLNLEENPYNNEEYVSKIKFVPNKPFKTTDEVIITVKKEVESYAGKEMVEDFVQRIKIESEITDIACDSMMAVDYQGTGVLEVSVLPAAAAKGRTIQVASTSTMIASTDAESITLNDDGKARIVVSGELPGNALLHLSMPEAGKEKYVAVNVVTKEEEVVKTPKASKLSGCEFENSYMLTLTCATKGATIYYTIDGSCPCDEQTRKKYTGPITLPEGQITLQAIAIREGMSDSDIATFNYVVKKEASGIKVIEESCDFEANYQDGAIVITGAKGSSCHIYDLQGRELATRSHISNQARINVPKTDVYVISVTFANEQTVVHKIMAR